MEKKKFSNYICTLSTITNFNNRIFCLKKNLFAITKTVYENVGIVSFFKKMQLLWIQNFILELR